ncbi:hypothetical protein [uncultured Rikenella sp.]|uniref:hypothetical protein n=1 Tax=uncultured Rikenella sp. TaxID=368003 RepID=UPI002625275E|nr:hypothetical protein [uncultured Rikenella sp.]
MRLRGKRATRETTIKVERSAFEAHERRAPGYRVAGSGEAANVSSFGYCWSSATSDTFGKRLGFSATWLDPCDAYGRGYGFQLRCLSE